MKYSLLILLAFFYTTLFAQKENFDLVSYTPPAGWEKTVTDNVVSYTISDKKNNTWCRINIVKSTVSKGSIELDFDSEWQEMIRKSFDVKEAPQTNEVQEADGWKIKAGAGKFSFNNGNAMALLTTISGYNHCVSVVSVTNNQDYIKDIQALLSSVELLKPEVNSQHTTNNNDNSPIIGTWGNSLTYNQQSNDLVVHVMGYGYNANQYTFNSNNTYYFVSKTFLSSDKKMLLVKENGTYQINGNNITITPQNSIAESWSKKDSIDKQGRPAGVDQWGKLLSSQKRTLETVTYQFTKHYFSGIQQWNFVLQNDKITQRDGPHSSNTTFSNAWYYSPISPNNPVIELPGGQKLITEEVKKETLQQTITVNDDNTQRPSENSIIGTWGISMVIPYRSGTEGMAGSTVKQYTFNTDGTYNFYIKTFRYRYDKLLLARENGTYQISGNNLTIIPQKSVIESWSKKDGTEKWGKFIATQNKTLEKTTYQFTKDYSSGVQQWNLVLQCNKATERDGPYNGGSIFSNAWLYSAVTCKNCFIKLPDQ